MRYILQGGLGQGPHMVAFFIARRHNPNKNSVGTALAIINIGGILGGAFFSTNHRGISRFRVGR